MMALWTPLIREVLPKWTPIGRTVGASLSTFRKTLHDDDVGLHAFGVDDVEVFIPASVQIYSVLDD